MSFARYAAYFVPPRDSELAKFGREWLGVDIETGELLKQATVKGVTKSRFNALTIVPRSYGFHGTLKPPFELAAGMSHDGLIDAIKLYAQGLSPIEIPALEISVIGKFIALVPNKSSSALENMAGGIVRSLEGFRRRKTEKEL